MSGFEYQNVYTQEEPGSSTFSKHHARVTRLNFIPPIASIFCAEFDARKGPTIAYQVPKGI